MTRKASFGWGSLGALAPEVVRFFAIVSRGQQLPNLNWALYVLFLAVYCILSGYVAIAWKPDAEWKALWVGASLPALIGTLVQSAPTHP